MSGNAWNLRLIAWYACWLLGGLLIAGGLAGRMWLPGFFKVWGRIEMFELARFQFYAYGAGMLLASIPFADPSPDAFEGKETRRLGCLLWLIGAAVLSYLVLDSLPP